MEHLLPTEMVSCQAQTFQGISGCPSDGSRAGFREENQRINDKKITSVILTFSSSWGSSQEEKPARIHVLEASLSKWFMTQTRGCRVLLKKRYEPLSRSVVYPWGR